jgi:hypothetical protein
MLAQAVPAGAHSVKCFAALDGDAISGYAWTGNGQRVRNMPFRVFDPDGDVLHEGTTDARGEFSFAPARACDHEIVVEAGEGHVARFTVLSGDLLAGGIAGPVADAEPSTAAAPARAEGGNDEAPAGAGDLESIVRRAVSSQIAPLRRELAEFRERRRLQDVIAGLGYIAGLAGAAFFFLGVRRRERW